ncbi:mitochondrial K+-H+ exchange-related-domain-containing protein [Geopyxis carbonaria]|nr:mitochondrial K+-H+ exchange-related-domain-containing protein [Geopyxis carbonaria]
MRLFLIPISTRRTLIYGQRLNKITHANPSLADKASARAANLWFKWETGEKKWQRQLTEQGNKLFNRIPFEEWGLKSVPPLSARRQQQEIEDKKIDVIYPPSMLDEKNIPSIIKRLGTERNILHRTRLTWSLIGLPISAPFGLVPLVPNIPFFYLLYRAFSHWKALEGAKHLKFLVDKDLINAVKSDALDAVYTRRSMNTNVGEELTKDTKVVWKDIKEVIGKAQAGGTYTDGPDLLLIQERDAQDVANGLEVPSLVVEIERACKQVTDQLEKEAQKTAQDIRTEEAQAAAQEIKQ